MITLQILVKSPQVDLIIIKKWPKNSLPPHPLPPPSLWNLDNFFPSAFYSTPTPTIRHKRVYSTFTHWVDQDLLLRLNKIKSIKNYWSLPLTDGSILWHFCEWTINTWEIFLLPSCFLYFRNQSCFNNKLISFLLSHSFL